MTTKTTLDQSIALRVPQPKWVHCIDPIAADSLEVVLHELRLLLPRIAKETQCASFQKLDRLRSRDIPFLSSVELEIPKVGGK